MQTDVPELLPEELERDPEFEFEEEEEVEVGVGHCCPYLFAP